MTRGQDSTAAYLAYALSTCTCGRLTTRNTSLLEPQDGVALPALGRTCRTPMSEANASVEVGGGNGDEAITQRLPEALEGCAACRPKVARYWWRGRFLQVNVLATLLASHRGGGILHGAYDLVVSGAPTQIARDAQPDLLLGWIRVLPEEGGRRDDEPGRTVPAL